MLMGYYRKIFATSLRDNAITTEIIDLLQGRVNSSIFAIHYYRPDFRQYCDRARTSVKSLHEEITQ